MFVFQTVPYAIFETHCPNCSAVAYAPQGQADSGLLDKWLAIHTTKCSMAPPEEKTLAQNFLARCGVKSQTANS